MKTFTVFSFKRSTIDWSQAPEGSEFQLNGDTAFLKTDPNDSNNLEWFHNGKWKEQDLITKEMVNDLNQSQHRYPVHLKELTDASLTCMINCKKGDVFDDVTIMSNRFGCVVFQDNATKLYFSIKFYGDGKGKINIIQNVYETELRTKCDWFYEHRSIKAYEVLS